MGCWRDYGGETGPGVKAPTPMDVPLPCRGPSSAKSSEVCPPAENLAQVFAPETHFPHLCNWGSNVLCL